MSLLGHGCINYLIALESASSLVCPPEYEINIICLLFFIMVDTCDSFLL